MEPSIDCALMAGILTRANSYVAMEMGSYRALVAGPGLGETARKVPDLKVHDSGQLSHTYMGPEFQKLVQISTNACSGAGGPTRAQFPADSLVEHRYKVTKYS